MGLVKSFELCHFLVAFVAQRQSQPRQNKDRRKIGLKNRVFSGVNGSLAR